MATSPQSEDVGTNDDQQQQQIIKKKRNNNEEDENNNKGMGGSETEKKPTTTTTTNTTRTPKRTATPITPQPLSPIRRKGQQSSPTKSPHQQPQSQSYLHELAQLQSKVFGLNLELHQMKTLYSKERQHRIKLEHDVLQLQQLQNSNLQLSEENYHLHHDIEDLMEDKQTLIERDLAYSTSVTYMKNEFSNINKHFHKLLLEIKKLQSILLLKSNPLIVQPPPPPPSNKLMNRSSSNDATFYNKIWEKEQQHNIKIFDACMMMQDQLDFAIVIVENTTSSLEELLADTSLPDPNLPVFEYQKDDMNNQYDDDDVSDINDDIDDGNEKTSSSNNNSNKDKDDEGKTNENIHDDDEFDVDSSNDENNDNNNRPNLLQSAFQNVRESILHEFSTTTATTRQQQQQQQRSSLVVGQSSSMNRLHSNHDDDNKDEQTTRKAGVGERSDDSQLLKSIPYCHDDDVDNETKEQQEFEMEQLVRELFFSHQLKFAEYVEYSTTTTLMMDNDSYSIGGGGGGGGNNSSKHHYQHHQQQQHLSFTEFAKAKDDNEIKHLMQQKHQQLLNQMPLQEEGEEEGKEG